MISELLETLRRASVEPGLDELLDALWLAQYVVVPDQVLDQLAAHGVPEQEVGQQHQQDLLQRSTATSAVSTVGTSGELYALAGDYGTTMKGIAVGSPAVPALRNQLALAKAFRPFMRRAPSRSSFEVDENATVARIADEGMWMPVLRPASERWLTLTFVVDTAASMIVWRRTVDELHAITQWMGAFRRVRVSTFDSSSDDLLRMPELEIGRRDVVVVITDTLGAAWRDGRMDALLQRIAGRVPVAVVTVLPQRMWPGTRLKITPGSMTTDAPRDGVRNGGRRRIPLVELSARWLHAWADLVTGEPRERRMALLAEPVAGSEARGPVALLAAAELVGRFRAGASPPAFRLACYLSATALNLPVMRLVQRVMLPTSDTAHLAEVFLGGLLRRVDQYDAQRDPETVQYEFLPGVRAELNNHMTRDELLTVLRHTSQFVTERFGQSLNFPALLVDPQGADLPAAAAGTGQPLAQVAMSALARLGGRYKALADRLTAGTSPVTGLAHARHFTLNRMWVRVMSDKTVRVGIVDGLSTNPDDRVEITLPRLGSINDEVKIDLAGRVEIFHTGLKGEITAVNNTIRTSPGLLSTDPYGRGWLYEMQVADVSVLENLHAHAESNTATNSDAERENTLKKSTDLLDIRGDEFESHWLPRAVNGDGLAIQLILRSIAPLVVRYCRARVGRGERASISADDVAQEVCLAVLNTLPSYQDQGRPFLAFVFGIAAHKVADARRSEARNRAESVADVPDGPDERGTPEQDAMRSDLSGRLDVLLGNLPEKMREILMLRVVIGLTAEETAKVVGSTPGAVRVAQHRALRQLRRLFSDEELQQVDLSP